MHRCRSIQVVKQPYSNKEEELAKKRDASFAGACKYKCNNEAANWPAVQGSQEKHEKSNFYVHYTLVF
jgi:hypothetical protein